MGNLLLQGNSIWTKNIGVIYQRAMIILFYDMMYKEIEVHVDNIITKSKK